MVSSPWLRMAAMMGFAASKEQRAKVTAEGCRLHGRFCGQADPAHVVPRSLGGCDHPDCVVPLCREMHRRYDSRQMDLLPYLSKAEQAHAVGHLGVLRALNRITNVDWVERFGPHIRY